MQNIISKASSEIIVSHMLNGNFNKESYLNNQEYKTIKEASEKTGIHPGTIIKYTIDGLFDMEQYRIGCARARVRPKL